MKKVIIGLSGMVIIALVVILFVNAQGGKAEGAKKPATEVASKCAGCPSASTCTEMKEAKTSSCCDSTKTEACETTKTQACPEAKAGCEATCPSKLALPVK